MSTTAATPIPFSSDSHAAISRRFERKRAQIRKQAPHSQTPANVNADSAFSAEFPTSIRRKFGSDFQPRFKARSEIRANLPACGAPLRRAYRR
jgi:hypothetical protein